MSIVNKQRVHTVVLVPRGGLGLCLCGCLAAGAFQVYLCSWSLKTTAEQGDLKMEMWRVPAS